MYGWRGHTLGGVRDEQRGLVDRTGWPPGPWDGEPDRIEWRHQGLACLVTRNPQLGNLCGYVAIPPGHPWHDGVPDEVELRAHGGVNYGERGCAGLVCHKPQPGESDDVFWIGFDCGHAWDMQPGMEAMVGPRMVGGDAAWALLRRSKRKKGESLLGLGGTYKPVPYVEAEVNKLADQVAAAQKKGR